MVWVTGLGNNTVTGKSCCLKPLRPNIVNTLSLNGYYLLFRIQISSFHKRLYLRLTSLSTPFVQTVLSKLMYLQITEGQISHFHKVIATGSLTMLSILHFQTPAGRLAQINYSLPLFIWKNVRRKAWFILFQRCK